ncbi:MAG: M13 family metallopeptidase [Verrucomicrobiota bacterium]
MDKTVDPGTDFFSYAAGNWLKNNAIPDDKARWSGFDELQERNWRLLRDILESSAKAEAPKNSPLRQVGDFFVSAMDTNRIESIGFDPVLAEWKRIDGLRDLSELFALLADLQQREVSAVFSSFVSADARKSSVYAYYLGQGGLGMPDRDYYLADGFARQREAYVAHMEKMFRLIGLSEAEARQQAKVVFEFETDLAKASKSRTELRDPIANYHKFNAADLTSKYPKVPLRKFLDSSGLEKISELVIRQPAFFEALDKLSADRSLTDWKTYLRWHVLREAAPYLHAAAEQESFAFYGTVLRGQPAQEPRWQRAARVIDVAIGEALGQLYVEKHFPPAAKARMNELIGNLKAVFRDRLANLEWMTAPTRAKALAKFERFTQKIGHPEKFRDYSAIEIRRDDYLGNLQRATVFESKRQLARIGEPVDKTEWHMTPQTVNAYFNPTQNEIVFPAGILQPPFFDVALDDPINYGAIGVVIGHEITHGYDDQGRKFDADGNLNDWWTEADAKAFEARAEKVVKQYNEYEPLPGVKINGQLTLGENIADLGGASIAYEALQRALAKDPSKRKKTDGFTPEQRFFLSLAQLWRTKFREAELRRRLTVDSHSPGQFRAIGPHVNLAEFFEAFQIKENAPMWRPPEMRAKIW